MEKSLETILWIVVWIAIAVAVVFFIGMGFAETFGILI